MNTDDKHHRQQMNHHLRAAIERALSLSTLEKRMDALARIIRIAQQEHSNLPNVKHPGQPLNTP